MEGGKNERLDLLAYHCDGLFEIYHAQVKIWFEEKSNIK